MILILSILLAIVVPIGVLGYALCQGVFWVWAILFAIGAFLATVATFCLLILILLPTLGSHFEKKANPIDPKCWRFMTDVAKFSCFWLGIRIHVHGLEKLPPQATYVFYSNHQSYIDPLIYHVAFSKIPHATMYKKVIDRYIFAGPMARALGGVSIDRDDDREAMESVVSIIKKVKKGVHFSIYPEGTRSRGIGLHHFKAGSFKIVQKSGGTLVLCALDGSYRKRLSIPFWYTPVHIEIVEVMTSEEAKTYPTHELATHCELLIKESITTIRNTYSHMRPSKWYIRQFEEQQKKEDVF
ncbi:MAG: 1-acyl-sn-glycerol-3-phosphate acyltransferase [Prevotella sp.]|nr:1-acyl-sn-glycerol-3-phosphate acyltransferase [Staphylococcus sp.]MCM1349595.1 1-acyl-sn-glycerol-3-phosphate acyltransferase [Prevotella sp.]